jgi:hypothetical protein
MIVDPNHLYKNVLIKKKYFDFRPIKPFSLSPPSSANNFRGGPLFWFEIIQKMLKFQHH